LAGGKIGHTVIIYSSPDSAATPEQRVRTALSATPKRARRANRTATDRPACQPLAPDARRGRQRRPTLAWDPRCQLSALTAHSIGTGGGATLALVCEPDAAPLSWISHTAWRCSALLECRCAHRADGMRAGGAHSCRVHYSPDILVNCRCPLTDGFRSCYCFRMSNLVKLWPAKSCRRVNVRCDAVYF
jgi:hypothetical protein